MTPLYIAAEEGYLNVCKLIAENVHKKNPRMGYESGQVIEGTPLQIAERNGHSSVVKYFQSLLDAVEQPRKKQRMEK